MNLIRIFLYCILLISSAIMTSEELSDELNYLKSSRSRIRAKCTRNCDYIDNEVDTLSHAELLTEIEFLRKIKTKLEGLDSGFLSCCIKLRLKRRWSRLNIINVMGTRTGCRRFLAGCRVL